MKHKKPPRKEARTASTNIIHQAFTGDTYFFLQRLEDGTVEFVFDFTQCENPSEHFQGMLKTYRSKWGSPSRIDQSQYFAFSSRGLQQLREKYEALYREFPRNKSTLPNDELLCFEALEEAAAKITPVVKIIHIPPKGHEKGIKNGPYQKEVG